MRLAPAVFGPLMNITGSILASYWHEKGSESYNTSPISMRKEDVHPEDETGVMRRLSIDLCFFT